MIPGGSRILIVEDEYFTAYYLETALGRDGFDVVASVTNGADAIEKAATTKPDIILMDIALAGSIDGLTAARRIRETNDAFILFVSGYQDDIRKAEALAIEGSAYLVKPVKLADIHRVFPREGRG